MARGEKRRCVCSRRVKVQQEDIWGFADRTALYSLSTQRRNVSHKRGVLKENQTGHVGSSCQTE